MGKLFLVHPGGKHIYCCKDCKTPIATKRDFIDRCKTIDAGHGLLFSASCNVKESKVSERILSPANEDVNIVRFLYCLKCKASMGWRYEYCENAEHRHREGNFLLFPNNLCPGK